MGNNKYNIGSIVSADLTVDDAPAIRDFYEQVVGWQTEDMAMNDENGSYSDFIMKDDAGKWVGGVCHSRGANLGIPPQWIVYVNVSNVGESVEKCKQMGGKIIKEVRSDDGEYYYAIIEDPAGAVLALTNAG